MTKRTVAAVLWLFAIWTVGNMVTTFTGLPSIIGPAAGLLVAALIWLGPAVRLWTRRTDSAVARRRIADLARVSEARPEPDLRREADTAQT